MCGRAGHIQPALTRQKEERPRRGSQAGWRKGSSYLGSLIECEIHKEIPKGLSFRLEFLERKHPFCTISQYISTYVDDFFQRTPDAAVLSVVIIIFNFNVCMLPRIISRPSWQAARLCHGEILHCTRANRAPTSKKGRTCKHGSNGIAVCMLPTRVLTLVLSNTTLHLHLDQKK